MKHMYKKSSHSYICIITIHTGVQNDLHYLTNIIRTSYRDAYFKPCDDAVSCHCGKQRDYIICGPSQRVALLYLGLKWLQPWLRT